MATPLSSLMMFSCVVCHLPFLIIIVICVGGASVQCVLPYVQIMYTFHA